MRVIDKALARAERKARVQHKQRCYEINAREARAEVEVAEREARQHEVAALRDFLRSK